ncbi:hypothetical protein HY641_01160 [Candidatus Woesearchaeota archaeon]|nr:hypothetical protein [Candidatus Woesearchaeota archaeon]
MNKLPLILTILLFVSSCAQQETTPSTQTPQAAPPITVTPAEPSCTTMDCFIPAANNCEDIDITLTQEAGTFTYSSTHCMLTKTLTRIEGPPELKEALEGRSLTCAYNKGEFDSRWIKTLIYGLEQCEGELKEKLAWMLMLT